MGIDQTTIDDAVQFLMDGKEIDAARVLRDCSLVNCDTVDTWMDGNRQLEGLLLEVECPRSAYDILSTKKHPITKSIENALQAVLPTGTYLKNLCLRAVSSKKAVQRQRPHLPESDMKKLIDAIEAQKALMIAVATGGPRIKDVSREYDDRRLKIKEWLLSLEVEDPNPYPDLWTWYGKWSDGSLPSYQSRRRYIGDLYQPLVEGLCLGKKTTVEPMEPTRWARVDRNMEKIVRVLELAKNEEDFQSVALLCREAVISLAQAVYVLHKHGTIDGVNPSSTDAKRMLESYIAKEIGGQSHEYHRKFSKAAFDLAVNLQHRRTATFHDAALCAEATRAIVNTIAILSGQRDPEK
jgi:hypothetical protein